MLRELRLQLVEARARRRDGFHDRRDPRAVLPELEHLEDLEDDPVRAVAVGFVHDEQVRDLHEARLDRLDVVAHARREDDDAGLGEPEHFDLVLPDADRLDEHLVEARRVEDVHGVGRRAREASEVAARRHRADQDARVRVEVLHPDAVAEDRPARERRRGVHRDDADSLPARAGAPRERRRERRLARPRRAREARDAGAARRGEHGGEELREAGVPALRPGDRACDGRDPAGEDPFGEGGGRSGSGHGRSVDEPRGPRMTAPWPPPCAPRTSSPSFPRSPASRARRSIFPRFSTGSRRPPGASSRSTR